MIVFARNLVVKDFWLKSFSLALAILIWLTVKFTISGEGSWSVLTGRASDEAVFTVPVNAQAGTSRAFTFDPPEVKITLHGDPKILADLHKEKIHAQVDLTGIESANGLFRPVEVILPSKVAYTQIEPQEVQVTVAPKN